MSGCFTVASIPNFMLHGLQPERVDMCKNDITVCSTDKTVLHTKKAVPFQEFGCVLDEENINLFLSNNTFCWGLFYCSLCHDGMCILYLLCGQRLQEAAAQSGRRKGERL